MANVLPQNPTDQLGTLSQPWAELHSVKGRLQGLQLPVITLANPNYLTFNAPNSGFLYVKPDGTLNYAQARVAYYTDFSPTMTRLNKFLAQEVGTGVHGEFPYIPQQYDTLYSVAIALQEHDASLTSLDARVTALETGAGDCCDIAINEISDVVISEPSGGQALVYDPETSTWVNGKLGVTYTEERVLAGSVPTSFTLAHDVLFVESAPQHIHVTVNGVAQLYATDYNVEGNTVTWASPDFTLELGDVLTFTYTGA